MLSFSRVTSGSPRVPWEWPIIQGVSMAMDVQEGTICPESWQEKADELLL